MTPSRVEAQAFVVESKRIEKAVAKAHDKNIRLKLDLECFV